MSDNLDSFLEHLDRYEKRIDDADRNIKRLVDRQTGLLKQKVKKIRERILRGRTSLRNNELASDSLPSGSSVSYQDNLANQESSVLPLNDSMPPPSHKRSREQQAARSHSTRRPKAKTGTENAADELPTSRGHSVQIGRAHV